MRKQILRIFLFLFSLSILIGLISYSDPLQLFSIIQQADLSLLFLGVILSTLSAMLRVLKWGILLRDISFTTLLPVQFLGLTVSNLTPGKFGEPGKALLLKARTGKHVAHSLPSIIWERILDILVLISLSFIVFPLLSEEFLLFGIAGVGFFSMLIIVLLFILYHERLGKKVFSFLCRFPIFNRISDQFIHSFYTAKIPGKRRFLAFIVTACAWLLDGAVFFLVFRAISVPGISFDLNLLVLLLGLISISTIIGVVSTLPGGIGSVEVSLAILLGLVDIPYSFAVSGVIIARFLTLWYSFFLGGLSFIYLSKKMYIKYLF